MATKSQLKPTPIAYAVGDDISVEQYNELVQRVGDWFAEIRNTKEPVKLAAAAIEACLKGVKPSDPTQTWDAAATAPLAKRIRMACRFDLETMQPLRTADEASKRKKQKEKDRQRRKKDEAKADQHYPEEFKKPPVGLEPTYGDDPAVFFTSRELETRAERRTAMLAQFPQLANIAAEPKLDMLLDLQLLFDRMRFRNAAAGADKKLVRATEQEMKELTQRIVELEKAMGIDPVTLAKTSKEKESGTVGDAIRRLESMGNWRELRLKYWAEELLLLYTMFQSPSPRTDMGGYQLDEVGLYGLTKTRVVECPHCGNKNWAGLKIEEIEQWLIDNGYLREVEGRKPGEYLARPSADQVAPPEALVAVVE